MLKFGVLNMEGVFHGGCVAVGAPHCKFSKGP